MKKDEIFREIIDIISPIPCKWWLDAGTCLAAVRKGDFIDPKDDVDIGIHITHTDPIKFFMEKFQEAGFILSKVRACGGKIMTIGFTGPEKLDLFVYYEKGEYFWHTICGWEDERKLRKVYKPEKFRKDLFLSLKEIRFKDRECFLPNPPEYYLQARYGKDWRIPNPDYKFWRDSQAIDMEFA